MMEPDLSPRLTTRPAQMDEGMTIAPINNANPRTRDVFFQAIEEKVITKDMAKQDRKFTIGIYWENELVGFSLQRRDADKRWNLRAIFLMPEVRETDLLGEFLRRWFFDKRARVLVKDGDAKMASALLSAGFYDAKAPLVGRKTTEHLYLKDESAPYQFTAPANYKALLSPEMGGYTDEELQALSVDPDAFVPEGSLAESKSLLDVVAASDEVPVHVATPSA